MISIHVGDSTYDPEKVSFSPMDVDHNTEGVNNYRLQISREELTDLLGEDYLLEQEQIAENVGGVRNYNNLGELLNNEKVSREVILEYFGGTYVLAKILGKQDKPDKEYTICTLDDLEISDMRVVLKGTGISS